MTTADSPHRAEGWTSAVRQRLGLGRLLPLGGPADGSWIAERAAATVLREATAGTGTVLGTLRIAPADEDNAPDPVVPGPPSALRPGPLRIEAGFATTARRPLHTTADALRAALLTAATRRLGLLVDEVDLRVTELLEEEPRPAPERPADVVAAEPAGSSDPAGTAAAGVPGVAALTHVLGSAVQHTEGHVRVELATAGDHRALDVAQAVRGAVADAVEGRPTVAVLVTAVVDRN
ncbi:hypothetical protein [Streptomyces sp. ADI93-02]|uniref:hypothetical protein n=1 Tax=Streptomyces sp. ADI93-02 TaxID=1522757 RepID=UPI000F5538C6|nr:hypothetical protein [Streptomyces sp. ADI93-02]RPK42066.1 hypothetical protein EES40_20115 [Streptomyces sp. ADI93-02]